MRSSETSLVAAHKHCAHHEDEIVRSTVCGCFYCLGVFPSSEIEDWLDDEPRTALCPRCGIDSVIGDAAPFPISEKDFLGAMNVYWFQRTVSSNGLFTRKASRTMQAVRSWLAAFRSNVS